MPNITGSTSSHTYCTWASKAPEPAMPQSATCLPPKSGGCHAPGGHSLHRLIAHSLRNGV